MVDEARASENAHRHGAVGLLSQQNPPATTPTAERQIAQHQRRTQDTDCAFQLPMCTLTEELVRSNAQLQLTDC